MTDDEIRQMNEEKRSKEVLMDILKRPNIAINNANAVASDYYGKRGY
jgi:hypothetical protein